MSGHRHSFVSIRKGHFSQSSSKWEKGRVGRNLEDVKRVFYFGHK